MAGIVMYDAITIDQIPADAGAVAGYVDGRWPTAALLLARFPHAHLLTIAVNAQHDADCLDIENGDASPEDAASWFLRQRARGITRPALYASASVMEASVVPVIRAAGIIRSSVRLWSAHYTGIPHICSPASCGAMSIEADGTQWTNSAHGRDLDASLLAANFFGTPPAPKPTPVPPEDDVQSGQLSNGAGAVTIISVPWDSAGNIAFGCDNDLQGLPPAKLRVAVYDTKWHVTDELTVDSAKGQAIAPFPDKAKTGVVSVKRLDDGGVVVGWQVS